MRLVLYIAIAFIIWRIVRAMTQSAPSPPPALRDAPRNERVESQRGPGIDYSRIRDAEWREGDSGGRSRDDADDAGDVSREIR